MLGNEAELSIGAVCGKDLIVPAPWPRNDWVPGPPSDSGLGGGATAPVDGRLAALPVRTVNFLRELDCNYLAEG